jgi:hypothetical protein
VICSPSQTGKILDVDCTCSYSLYDDIAGSYRPYGGDVAAWIGRLLTSTMLTRVIGWSIIGGHVAQSKGTTCRSLIG